MTSGEKLLEARFEEMMEARKRAEFQHCEFIINRYFNGRCWMDYDEMTYEQFERENRYFRQLKLAFTLKEKKRYPFIYFIALPKSASACITQTIARKLGIYRVRTSLGTNFVNNRVITGFLYEAIGKHCITHEHISGANNIEKIRWFGIRKLWLHFRNPFDATISLVEHKDKKLTEVSDDEFIRMFTLLLNWMMEWHYIAVEQKHKQPQILITTYRDFVESPESVINKGLEFFNVKERIDSRWIVPTNFNKGIIGRGQKHFERRGLFKHLHASIPNEMVEAYGWRESW